MVWPPVTFCVEIWYLLPQRYAWVCFVMHARAGDGGRDRERRECVRERERGGERRGEKGGERKRKRGGGRERDGTFMSIVFHLSRSSSCCFQSAFVILGQRTKIL